MKQLNFHPRPTLLALAMLAAPLVLSLIHI